MSSSSFLKSRTKVLVLPGEERLVKTGLVLVGNNQHPIILARETLRQLLLRQTAIHTDFGVCRARIVRVLDRSRERHQCSDAGISLLADVAIERLFVLHRRNA